MHFVVQHHTRYRYDVPVSLGRHVLRMTPQGERVQLHRHMLRVFPEPVEQRSVFDAYGNLVLELHFMGSCRELRIDSDSELDTLPAYAPEALPPLPWPVDVQLQPDYYGRVAAAASVQAFAHAVASDVSYQALPFLDHLTGTLFTRFDRGIRPTGGANSAAETLACGGGACRDLAVLFMEASRCLGFASRFVSGYQASAQTHDGQRHLHAWAEVNLPSVGFRGWDPMHGVRVADGHVALCAAPEQSATMPVEGAYAFAGSTLRSTLDFSLRIDTT